MAKHLLEIEKDLQTKTGRKVGRPIKKTNKIVVSKVPGVVAIDESKGRRGSKRRKSGR